MEKLSAYNIAFKGLKEGQHFFDFHIGNSFFEFFENSLVEQAEAVVQVGLEKRGLFMTLHFSIKGTVKLPCDLCLELYDQEIKHEADVFVKFSDITDVDDDEVIWLSPEEHQINVAQLIYEYITLSVPLRHVHPMGKNGQRGCDPAMLRKIDELSKHNDENTDERWSELKKILNNNN